MGIGKAALAAAVGCSAVHDAAERRRMDGSWEGWRRRCKVAGAGRRGGDLNRKWRDEGKFGGRC